MVVVLWLAALCTSYFEQMNHFAHWIGLNPVTYNGCCVHRLISWLACLLRFGKSVLRFSSSSHADLLWGCLLNFHFFRFGKTGSCPFADGFHVRSLWRSVCANSAVLFIHVLEVSVQSCIIILPYWWNILVLGIYKHALLLFWSLMGPASALSPFSKKLLMVHSTCRCVTCNTFHTLSNASSSFYWPCVSWHFAW